MNTLITLSCLGVLTLFTGVYNLRKLILPVVILGLLTGLGLLVYDGMDGRMALPIYNNMLWFDKYALVFSGLMIGLTLLISLFWFQTHKNVGSHIADNYGLIIFSLTGGVILASYWNLSMLFLGIEILSIPVYILAGSRRSDLRSNEAAIKYFLMGSFSTGFMLYGIALIYGVTGTFDLEVMRENLANNGVTQPFMFSAGLLLLMVGLAFKVSAVPFHFWTPDVYQGAPTWITTYMASVVKVAGFAAFFRLFHYVFAFEGVVEYWQSALWLICALTIVLGNLLAITQKNVKRMLAYSSIANAGYILLALLSLNEDSQEAMLYYLAAYGAATIGAFAVLMLVENERESTEYKDFNGLFHVNPAAAAVMTICLLSLAGIPPLAGFFGKYYLFFNAVEDNWIQIVILAVLASLAGIYYYFRVIVAMFSKEQVSVELPIGGGYAVGLFIVAVVTVVLGLMPQLVLGFL